MTNWDDIRSFLAVARSPTVRAAADRLGVNHSTMLRRISQLDTQLHALLFDKLPSGYRLSSVGTEVFDIAEEMESLASRFEGKIVGRDQMATGLLRVAVAPTIATYLLMPDLAEFARLYPDVEIELLTSNEPVNLTNREADVAIRVVYDRDALPLNLHGAKGLPLYSAVYIARDLLTTHQQGGTEPIRWIIRSDHGRPSWAQITTFPVSDIVYRMNDAESQIAAARQRLGITALSCFIGDRDPLLIRVPDTLIHLHGNVWTLTHEETRNTKRVRLFIDFINRRLLAHRSLLAGEA